MKIINSKKILSKYGKYLYGGVELLPNIIKKGNGSYVWDQDGNKFLDLNAGQFCSIFGHSFLPLSNIVANQLKIIGHTGTNVITEDVLLAAKKISSISLKMNGKSIFLSTGAEAVECSLRYAKHLKNKNGLVCFSNGYHGLSLGSQSVTFGGKWSLPRINNIYSVDPPTVLDFNNNNISNINASLIQIEKIFKEKNEEIAAFIMEPIISVGGMIFLNNYYCESIYNLCKKYEIYLIYDECQTGIGRTGKYFCYQHFNLVPDILISAKAIGLGLPVSVVVFNSNTIKLEKASVNHFSSHQNDPLSAVVVSYVLDKVDDLFLDSIVKKGDYFLNKLVNLSKKYEFIVNCRGKGLMLGFDIFVKNISSYIEIGKIFSLSLLKEGVILQSTSHGKTYRLLPNYCISFKEIDFFIDKLELVINKIKNNVKKF